MNACAKKVVAIANVEGEDEPWQIKCDMVSEDDAHFAVLQWGPGVQIGHAKVVRLDPALLSPSQREGVEFDYVGRSIPVPRDLALMKPAGLTEEGFRLGFFRIG